MRKFRLGFMRSSQKTFLIGLVSALGFAGMVGYCILDRNKRSKVDPDTAGTGKEAKTDVSEQVEVQSDMVAENDLSAGSDVPRVALDEVVEVSPLVDLPDAEVKEDIKPDSASLPWMQTPLSQEIAFTYGPRFYMDPVPPLNK